MIRLDVRPPAESSRTSQHYRIEGFMSVPPLCHHDAKRRQPLGQPM